MLDQFNPVCYKMNVFKINIFIELTQELTSFKTETARVQEIKRKLLFEKDKLMRELKDFEKQRDEELMKIEEERRKLKRDKLLLDRANREAKNSNNCVNCKENRAKAQKVLNELRSKEKNWNAAINNLKEEINKIEQEKSGLRRENVELRNMLNHHSDEEFPDSGFRSQELRLIAN